MSKSKNIIVTNEFGNKDFLPLFSSEFKVFHFPMIKTVPTNKILDLDNFDFIIFTSKNGIRFFMDSIKDPHKLKFKKIISLGSKTSDYLKEFNINSYFTSPKNYAEVMLEEIKKRDFIKDKKVLLVQGNLASNNLFEGLKKFSIVERLNVYNTLLEKKIFLELEKIILDNDTYTVFTSPSCFDAFILNYEALRTNIISIGTTTTNFIEKKGYKALMTSKMQTYDSLSSMILEYLRERK